MKVSELTLLNEGVYELEKGYAEWDPDQCEVVVIAFAGFESVVELNNFDDDQEFNLPLPLEDCRLEEVEVHHEGWYIEPTFERVEELAPRIHEFLPRMLVGQKVMMVDNNGGEQVGRTYVVKLISVHKEAPTKLCLQEKRLLDAVRKVKPIAETDWTNVAAIVAREQWREIMEKFEVQQCSTAAAVQEVKISDISEMSSSSTESSTPVPLDASFQRLKRAVLDSERKKKPDLESKRDTENSLAHRPRISGHATPPRGSQEIKGIEHPSRNMKRWSLYQG